MEERAAGTVQNGKKLVIGVIGADVHAVGNKILDYAFTLAGFNVINLGVMVSQEEYIEAAIELSNGNMSETARRLGINRTTLYNRMEGWNRQ